MSVAFKLYKNACRVDLAEKAFVKHVVSSFMEPKVALNRNTPK